MAKYLNRLAARVALAKLKESKNWIVTRNLICETDEGDVEFNKGEMVNVGGDEDGNLVLDGSAAVVVICDADVAEKVAEVLSSADELSDVEFVQKPALDAVLDGEDVEDVVDALGDTDGEDIEVAEVDVDDEKKESVENKYNKFAENVIHASKKLKCESVAIEESASPIRMSSLKTDAVKKESYNDYKEFASRVSALKGSIKPGKREIALTEAGEVMGAYDTEADFGEIYPENSWEDEAAMDSFDDSPIPAVEDMPWDEDEDAVAVESCLGKYEESAKNGKDYMTMVESLEKAGVKEEKIGLIVSTFNRGSLKECSRVFDSKYGKFVAEFKESADTNNFIVETGDENRFSKRYFG